MMISWDMLDTSVLDGHGRNEAACNQLHSQAGAVFGHTVLNECFLGRLVDRTFVGLVFLAQLFLTQDFVRCSVGAGNLVLAGPLNCRRLTFGGGNLLALGTLFGLDLLALCLLGARPFTVLRSGTSPVTSDFTASKNWPRPPAT